MAYYSCSAERDVGPSAPEPEKSVNTHTKHMRTYIRKDHMFMQDKYTLKCIELTYIFKVYD